MCGPLRNMYSYTWPYGERLYIRDRHQVETYFLRGERSILEVMIRKRGTLIQPWTLCLNISLISHG